MLTVDQLRTLMADPESDRVEKLNAIMLRSYESNDRHQVRSDHRADRGQGERFVITRHKHPVAELIPLRRRDADRIRAAIDGLEEFQRTHSLGGCRLGR